MSDIFISYAREDQPRVALLATELNRCGWTVWYDNSLAPSEEFDERLEHELDAALCVVVLWSHASIRSKWVRAEAGAADDQGKLIPITFDSDIVPPMRFRQLHLAKLPSASFERPAGAALALLKELSAATGKPYRGAPPEAIGKGRAGGRSGAKVVTPGKWTVTTRFLLAKANFYLELLPSGMVTGTGAWTISRARMSGRWHYDASAQLLQLEMSGGISKGMESISIQVIRWDSEDSATCTFAGYNATRDATIRRG